MQGVPSNQHPFIRCDARTSVGITSGMGPSINQHPFIRCDGRACRRAPSINQHPFIRCDAERPRRISLPSRPFHQSASIHPLRRHAAARPSINQHPFIRCDDGPRVPRPRPRAFHQSASIHPLRLVLPLPSGPETSALPSISIHSSVATERPGVCGTCGEILPSISIHSSVATRCDPDAMREARDLPSISIHSSVATRRTVGQHRVPAAPSINQHPFIRCDSAQRATPPYHQPAFFLPLAARLARPMSL